MANCCVECFDIQEIKDFIRNKKTNGNCCFCDSTNVAIAGTEIVGKFIQAAIDKKYEDANVSLPWDSETGDYAIGSVYDAYEILDDLERIYSENVLEPYSLTRSLVEDDEKYTVLNPLGPDGEGKDDIELWNYFCDEVKMNHDHVKFEDFFANSGENDTIFENIVLYLKQCIQVLEVGTTLYRARINNKLESYINKDLTSAPTERAKTNRMSPEGMSFFYGAFEPKTAMAEISPNVGDIVSVGKFEVIKKIKVFDLSLAPAAHNIFNPTYDYFKECTKCFLRKFGKEISKPIDKSSSDIEYIPTQIFTEYIRSVPNHSFDGIAFHSSQNTNGKNVALFYGPEISINEHNPEAVLLEFKEYKNYKIKSIPITFEEL